MDFQLPPGVTHLHGSLYLVPFDLILVAEPVEVTTACSTWAKQGAASLDDKPNYKLANPRQTTQSGQAQIYNKKKSSDLRNDIKERTMLNPMLCRWTYPETGVIGVGLVGGHRRHDAVSFLIRKKEMVKDPASRRFDDSLSKWVFDERPADEVYQKVMCQVFDADTDLDALILSYAENENRENFLPGHKEATVLDLRRYKDATDERICEVVGEDARWLAETDRLISALDPESLVALCEGRLDRDGAVYLTTIESVDDRLRVLEHCSRVAEEGAKRLVEKIHKSVTKTRSQQELAETEAVYADLKGDTDGKKKAEARAASLSSKAKALASDREKVVPVVNARSVKAAIRVVGGTTDQKEPKQTIPCLRPKKIKEGYVDVVATLIKGNGDLGDGVFMPLATLKVVEKVLQGIWDGNENLESILKRAAKVVEKKK